MTEKVVLKVENVSKSFNRHQVVQPISFTLQKGKCYALIGQNGAGKTTLLRILTGLLKATDGSVNYRHNKQKDFRYLVGYLPQYPAMYGWMSAYQYLIFHGKLAGLSKELAHERAENLLKRVNIYEDRKKQIRKFSGGMKQRLGIAQALIHEPQLLILDEPVSALDPLGRREVLTLMEELKEETTILFSTHILSDADEVSDELLLLHEGKLVESGSIENLRKKYETTSFSLKFSEDIQLYEAKIKSLPHVIRTYTQRNTLHITADNIEKVRKLILQMALDENWPLIEFKLDQASLEDMFMKVVTS